MVEINYTPVINDINSILNQTIDHLDICKVYFMDFMPDVFCNKGLNNIRMVNENDVLISCYMFSYDKIDYKYGCYLYLNSTLNHRTLYNILHEFLTAYIKLSENRGKIDVGSLSESLSNMRKMHLIPLKEIDAITSDDYIIEQVEYHLSKI